MELSTVSTVDCEFSIKTANAIRHHLGWSVPLVTLDQMSDDEILRIPGMGRKGLREIREIITGVRQHQPSPSEALREIAGIVVGDRSVGMEEIVDAVRRLKAEYDALLLKDVEPDAPAP